MHGLIAHAILHDRRIAYAVTDRNLNVVEFSSANSIFFNSSVNWLGHRLLELVPELVGCEEMLADLLTGEAERFQLPWVNRELPDGQVAYLTMIDLPFRDQTGRITGLIHIIHDVTEAGRLEQCVSQQRNELRLLHEELLAQNTKLEARNAELSRLDEMKSSFVSIAAHELRTPLAAISGYLEVMLDGEAGQLTQQQSDYLRIVENSAHRLLHITNQLLDSTRIEMGRLELVLQRTDLIALLHNVALELAPRFDAKAQRIVLRAALDLPDALCDAIRAGQVISNLLDNASKYSPPGATVTAEVQPAEEDGFLQLSVTDQGVGIAREEADRLFSPFYRTGGAALNSTAGVGLGLFIARSLAELHGGRIWFHSVPGDGSTFYVTFPVADQVSVPAPP